MVNNTEVAVVNTVQDISSLADAFHKSGMFKDTSSAAQAIVKIVAGKELGLGPVYSMTRINMIQGKLGLAAETLGALIKRSNKYNYTVKEHDETKCTIDFTENGKLVYTSTFTIEDAKRANLVKPDSGWVKYPRAMLFSRALSQGARIVAPDVIGGAYTVEELTSIDPPKTEQTDLPLNGTTTPVIEGEVTTQKEPEKTTTPETDTEHYCSTHNVKFFKTAKMRSYAHPIAEHPGSWCYEKKNGSKTQSQASQDTEDLFA